MIRTEQSGREHEESNIGSHIYRMNHHHVNHYSYDHNDLDESDIEKDMLDGDQDFDEDEMNEDDMFSEDEEEEDEDDIDEDIELQQKLSNVHYVQSQLHSFSNQNDLDEEDMLFEDADEEKEDNDMRMKTIWSCRGNNDLNCTCNMHRVEKAISKLAEALSTKIQGLYRIVQKYAFYTYLLIIMPILQSNLLITLSSKFKKKLASKHDSGGDTGNLLSLIIIFEIVGGLRETIVKVKKDDTFLDVKRKFYLNLNVDANTARKREKEDVLYSEANVLEDNANCHGIEEGDKLYLSRRRDLASCQEHWIFCLLRKNKSDMYKNISENKKSIESNLITFYIFHESPEDHVCVKSLKIKRDTTIREVKRLLTSSVDLRETEFTLSLGQMVLDDDATPCDLRLEKGVKITLRIKEDNCEDQSSEEEYSEEECIPTYNQRMEYMKKKKREKNRKKKEKKRKKKSKRITLETDIATSKISLDSTNFETNAVSVHENKLDIELKTSNENTERKGKTELQNSEVELGTLGPEEDNHAFEIPKAASKCVEAELQMKETKHETHQTSDLLWRGEKGIAGDESSNREHDKEVKGHNDFERDPALHKLDDKYNFDVAENSIVEDIGTGVVRWGSCWDSAFDRVDHFDIVNITEQHLEEVHKLELVGQAARTEQYSQYVQKDELGPVAETEMQIQNVHEAEQLPKVTVIEKLCLGAHKTEEIEVKMSDANIDRIKEAEPEKENGVELRVLGTEEDKYLFEITQALSKRVEAELQVKKTKLELLQTEKVSLEKTLEKNLALFDVHKDNVKSIIDSKAKDMKNILVLIDKEEDKKNTKVKMITDIDSRLVELEAQIFALKVEKNNLIVDCEKADDKIKKFNAKKIKLENVIGSELVKAKEEGNNIDSAIHKLKEKLAENSRCLHNLPNEQITYCEVKTIEPNKQLLDFIGKQIGEKEKELECPVCFDIARIPIFMCIESHLICSNCRPKIFECPECRLAYSGKPKRHRYAERAAEELNRLKSEKQELLKNDHSS